MIAVPNNNNDRPLVLDDLRELWGALREVSDRQATLNTEIKTMSSRQEVLDDKVETRMVNEEVAMDGMRADIRSVGDKVATVGAEVQRLLDAMPEDEHGRKDIFGHKIDHKEHREARTRKEDAQRSFRDAASEIIAKVAIAATIVVVLGEKAAVALKHAVS